MVLITIVTGANLNQFITAKTSHCSFGSPFAERQKPNIDPKSAPNITEPSARLDDGQPLRFVRVIQTFAHFAGRLRSWLYGGWLEDQPWERQWQWLVFDTGGAISILKNDGVRQWE